MRSSNLLGALSCEALCSTFRGLKHLKRLDLRYVEIKLSQRLLAFPLILPNIHSGNDLGKDQWKAIIPSLDGCENLEIISDFSWSEKVLSRNPEVEVSRASLHEEAAMAVLAGLLKRAQATQTITKLDLRSDQDKVEGHGYCCWGYL